MLRPMGHADLFSARRSRGTPPRKRIFVLETCNKSVVLFRSVYFRPMGRADFFAARRSRGTPPRKRCVWLNHVKSQVFGRHQVSGTYSFALIRTNSHKFKLIRTSSYQIRTKYALIRTPT